MQRFLLSVRNWKGILEGSERLNIVDRAWEKKQSIQASVMIAVVHWNSTKWT